MTESRKDVLNKTLVVLLGEAVGLALMYAVYALLGKFSLSVLLGGIIGAVLSAANFFFMAITVTLAADRAQNGDPTAGQKLIKGTYPVRLLVLAVILFACAKSGLFDVVALVLPLVFVRPTITVAEFFKKKGA